MEVLSTKRVRQSVRGALRATSHARSWPPSRLALLVVSLSVITSCSGNADFETSTFVFEGESMEPTISNGASFELRLTGPTVPERSALVVLSRFDGGGSDRQLLKRTIALPGETIEITSCVVYIDGEALSEPYLDVARQQQDGCGPDQPELTIPEGAIFVLGDNRGRSSDSRAFGPVSTDFVVGIVEE